MSKYNKKDIDRFMSNINKVIESGCWEWKNSVVCHGYGNIKINKKNIRVHRFSYELHYGEFEPELHVLHKCDNRKCVNPEHLFLGINKDNVDDKVSKDRQAQGSQNGNSLLNENQVKEIKVLLQNKYYGYIKDMCEKYDVSERCIFDIKLGRTWKHI